MKNRTHQLDVDIIGDQDNPLTEEEKQAISDFIRAYKEKRQLKAQENKPILKREAKDTAR